MSKITKNVITTKTKYDNTASYQDDDTNAYVPLTDVLIAGEGVTVTTDAQGRVVVSASGGGGGGGGSLNKYTFTYNSPFSANDFGIIHNIVENAKGRVYISVLGELNLVLQSLGGDFAINASVVQYDLNYIVEYRLFIDEGEVKCFTYVTSFSSSSSTEPYVEREDISEMITSVDVIYYNDSEILTPIS